MSSLSTHSVVDRMVAQLAERRRSSIGRRAAYVALAQAILNDEHTDLLTAPALERRLTAVGTQSAAAA
jgi:hypothetical protein